MPTGADSVRRMSARDTVTFYLPPQLRKQAERGNHNFIKKVGEVLTGCGPFRLRLMTMMILRAYVPKRGRDAGFI